MNERIRVREVRLIDAEGKQVGVVPTDDARRMAAEAGFDLVEVAPDARPPVCKIMDYGKYKYELSKKEQKSRAASKSAEMKEVRLGRSIKIDSHDVQIRVDQARRFLMAGHKVLFTGFLRGDDVRRIYRMADLYVMPSVSEPFGIAPLEAISNDVPVIISKQSGVSEVLTHALKVDFWDIDEMANKIVAVLRHPPLQRTLRQHGSFEVRRFSWSDSAAKCLEVYRKAAGWR